MTALRRKDRDAVIELLKNGSNFLLVKDLFD